MAVMAGPAVSVRSILRPSEKGIAPMELKYSASSSLMPPSGPTMTPILLAEASIDDRTALIYFSLSSSYAKSRASKPSALISFELISWPTAGIMPRLDCFAASIETR